MSKERELLAGRLRGAKQNHPKSFFRTRPGILRRNKIRSLTEHPGLHAVQKDLPNGEKQHFLTAGMRAI